MTVPVQTDGVPSSNCGQSGAASTAHAVAGTEDLADAVRR
jgi:hypothetical protein